MAERLGIYSSEDGQHMGNQKAEKWSIGANAVIMLFQRCHLSLYDMVRDCEKGHPPILTLCRNFPIKFWFLTAQAGILRIVRKYDRIILSMLWAILFPTKQIYNL